MIYKAKKILVWIGWILTTLLVVALINFNLCWSEEQQYGKAHIKIINGVQVLYLYGTPEEMGEQHGHLMKPEIQTALKDWLRPQFRTDKDWEKAKTDAHKLAKFIPDDYLRELKALAKAAEVPYNELLLSFTFTDMRAFEQVFMHCTAIVAYGKATRDGSCYLARNFDFPGKGILHNMVIVYHPKGKFSFASLIWPGMIGPCTAMNEKGLALTLNIVMGQPYGDALPQLILYRMIMENCNSIEEAVRMVQGAKRSGGWNLTLATKEEGSVVELNRAAVKVRMAEKEVVYTCNHFVELKGGVPDFRWSILSSFKSENYGQIDLEKIKNLLVQVSLIPCHSIVMQPKERIMHVTLTGPKEEFHQLTAQELFEVGPASESDNKADEK